MPAIDTIMLPPGTNKQTIINLPLCGGWIGGVHFSIVTWPATATIHELIFIADQGKSSIPATFRSIPGWTMAINTRYGWFLERYEGAVKIRYTATNNISANVETNRNAEPYNG